MLANEQLIVKMSLEQKVKFVTSFNAYESSPVGNYEFPVLRLKGQPYDDCPDVCATRFPSDKALAASWNLRLIGDVYSAIGNEMRRLNPFGYFNNTDDNALENVSGDYFVTAKFILARILGLTRSRQPVNFEKTHVENGGHTYGERLIADTVLSAAKPTSVLVRQAEDIEKIAKKFKYDNAFFGTASSVEETVRLLLAGCSLVFLSGDFTPELVKFLTERTYAYRKDYQSYRNGSLTLGEFDSRVRNCEIFDEEIIDKACDRLISLLCEMKSGGENIPVMHGLDENRPAKFDEISHDALALRAARESVVLLKNDGVLPLTHRTSVAVAGEYANDFSYQRELFGFNPTVQMLPFNVINEYEELTTTGYVAGYAKGESGRADLISSAVDLGAKSDCMLLYLCAGKGQTSLPPEQLELIDALSAKGVRIIAVVACDENIDLSFAEQCKAVLLTYNGGQEGTAAVLDIICGIVSPSGKLTGDVSGSGDRVLYPLGCGLSYTKFEYRNFRVNLNGVGFTVANTGEFDGFASVQLYVKKEGAAGFFSRKTLRGFAKTFVKKGDAVNVEIAFDENTFKEYSDSEKCYVIEGGDYEIAVSENYGCDVLNGTVTLRAHVYKEMFTNEIVETSDGADIEFTGDRERAETVKARKKLSFGVKLFLALILALYYNGVLAVFAFTPVISDKSLLLYTVLGAIAAVLNVLLVVYIFMIAKQRKKQLYLPANDVLTDLVGKVQPFKEIAKVTYAVPVKEKENAEAGDESKGGEAPPIQKPDGLAEPVELDEPVEPAVRTFDASLDESEEEIAFVEQISLAEICSNFREFARTFGVSIEVTSVRAVFSALAASKIVILKSVNTEAMPDFLDALGAYFGAALTEVCPDWGSKKDLFWKPDGNRYVVSDFINAVHGAGKYPAKMCAAILTHVDAERLTSYFGDFVEYANHPSEEYRLKLSDGLTVKLPNNMTYFLVPDEGTTASFPKDVVNASMCVDLTLSKIEKEGEAEADNDSLADFDDLGKDARGEVFLFDDLVKAARGEVFLPEKIWKKLDELVDMIGATEKFEIGNKNTLQIERFTSVLLDCGADEAEAFEQMLICKLVPLLKTTRLYKQEGGDRTISDIIEKLFPDEEITKIQKALAKQG